MSLIQKFKRAVRGDVDPKTLLLEARRRTQVAHQARRELANLDRLNSDMPKLRQAHQSPAALLSHFRDRREPRFFAGLAKVNPSSHHDYFPEETELLLQTARQIVSDHSWSLLGFGSRDFGEEIDWHRDPLSGYLWPLDYHRHIELIRNDGSDVRVLWELNRLGHLLTLAQAYSISGDELFSRECLAQLESWSKQNPYGRGVNWACAMEVALRSINLLTVFQLLKASSVFSHKTLELFLRLFHQHGVYIESNLEFSYLSTSNHYLSDLAGLLWLSIMLPEFRVASDWRKFALLAFLNEMDKQVLPDGADYESSTGYHRFVLELFLYTFVLCKENGIDIPAIYWRKLHSMLEYVGGYLRPDGFAPLIGDSDGAQVLPFRRRSANDHAYVLAIGAAIFNESDLRPANLEAPPELLWLLGDEAHESFKDLKTNPVVKSRAFTDAGLYVMSSGDLCLSLNTSDAGINGRGSHGHNDALSIEVSVGRTTFIVDPGSYVYTANLEQRHLFRSTAYHSTVKIDGEEQNTTLESVPFVIGNEAKPRVRKWETKAEMDRIVAEHSGYQRLPTPVIHRRTIIFYKTERYWLMEDEFYGDGEHQCEVRFHLAPNLEVQLQGPSVRASDQESNARLTITALSLESEPVLETQASSRDYGQKQDSITVCWRVSGRLSTLRWKLVADMSDML